MSTAEIPIHSKDAISSSMTDTVLSPSAERRVKIVLICRKIACRGTSVFSSREGETCDIASTNVSAPESRYGARFKFYEFLCEQPSIIGICKGRVRTDREPIAFHRPISSEIDTSTHLEPLDSLR